MVFFEILSNLQQDTCARVSFLIKLQASAYNFIKTESLAQVFSCEFCEISKNSFFTEHLWVAAFELMKCQNFITRRNRVLFII